VLTAGAFAATWRIAAHTQLTRLMAVAGSSLENNLLKNMVGPWGLEPQTSTVSIRS